MTPPDPATGTATTDGATDRATDSATDDRPAGWSAPPSRRDDTVEVLHGVEVADPYRWLEAIDSDEVTEWVAAQNAATESWLAEHAPRREALRARLDELTAITVRTAPKQRQGRWFGLRRDPQADQPALVVADQPGGEERVLIDPAGWGPTSTIADWQPNADGTLVAYARSDAGSDWMVWRVREVAGGEDRPDELRWSKFGTTSWLDDGRALIYSAFDPPPEGVDPTAAVVDAPRITLHRLGDEQSADTLLHREADTELLPDAEVSDDDRWLILTVSRGTLRETLVRAVDLSSPERPLIDVVGEADALHHVVTTDGDRFYLVTDFEAPLGRLVVVDVTDPARRRREVIAEADARLLSVDRAAGAFVVHRLRDAASALQIHDLDGRLRQEVELPPATSVTELQASSRSPLVTLTMSSFTDPGSVWLLDTTDGGLRKLHDFAAEPPPELAIDRVHTTSADGTPVPMWLIHRPEVTATGDVPTLLWGYGGFDIPVTPSWRPEWAAWVDSGGLLAVANLRGGGEFGKEWYDAGRRARKQNVFDDALECARWLAGSGWTRAERIAINGGSNGGLLTGACLTQAPELFGAAVPQVGVLDMLRFHKFTIGWAWASDYGNPDEPEGFQWVRAYSPLHNVRPGTMYPPTLITTGDHDDRVMPAHSYKFAAALQAAQAGDGPILLRIDVSAGHGGGKPRSKLIEERADVLAFLWATIGA